MLSLLWFHVFQCCSSARGAQFGDFVIGNAVTEETPLTDRLADRPLPQRPSDKKHHLQRQRG